MAARRSVRQPCQNLLRQSAADAGGDFGGGPFDHRTELADALFRHAHERSRNGNRTDNLGVLVVDRSANATQALGAFFVVDRPAALAHPRVTEDIT